VWCEPHVVGEQRVLSRMRLVRGGEENIAGRTFSPSTPNAAALLKVRTVHVSSAQFRASVWRCARRSPIPWLVVRGINVVAPSVGMPPSSGLRDGN